MTNTTGTHVDIIPGVLPMRRSLMLSLLVPVLSCWATLAVAAPIAHDTLPTPPGLNPGDVYHRIFVSSFLASIDSNPAIPTNFPAFGGLAGGDWNVSYAAEQAGLITNWDDYQIQLPLYHAILSSNSVNARDRLSIVGPIYNMHNELIATSEADLWDGSLTNAIAYNEFGVQVSVANAGVWTGTGSSGTSTGTTATDWLNQAGNASIGNALSSSNTWAFSATRAATLTARLYGLSPAMVAVPEPSSMALAVSGLAALVAWGWRKRR